MSFKESCVVLCDMNPIYFNIGDEMHVDFDFQHIWRLYRSLQYLSPKIHCIHYHPLDFPELSSMDKSLIKAWAIALFPKSFLFDIVYDIKQPAFLQRGHKSFECYLKNGLIEIIEKPPLTADYIIATIKFLSFLSYGENQDEQ